MRALLNGRILKNIKVFKNFDIDFLSDITKKFQKQTFAMDDNIIQVSIITHLTLQEEDAGGTMYFIVTGLVTIIHRKTQTYIRDLK